MCNFQRLTVSRCCPEPKPCFSPFYCLVASPSSGWAFGACISDTFHLKQSRCLGDSSRLSSPAICARHTHSLRRMTYLDPPSRHSRPRLRTESIKSYLRLVLRSNWWANEVVFRPTGAAYGAGYPAENFIRIYSFSNLLSAAP